MSILSKLCNSDTFGSFNSLKLSFTHIPSLCSNFTGCESFLESNSPDILALQETNLDDSIDSGNFSVRGYLTLIWKIVTHMHGLAVYVKEELSFMRDSPLENSEHSYSYFQLVLHHSATYFFFLYQPPSLCMVFDAFSSTIMKCSQSTHLLMY